MFVDGVSGPDYPTDTNVGPDELRRSGGLDLDRAVPGHALSSTALHAGCGPEPSRDVLPRSNATRTEELCWNGGMKLTPGGKAADGRTV